ncbi:9694_t:CDS:2 [Paraglomus occultum]|uniref:Probable 26S proteasome regulatory subunit p27 n=1 Tax=Paraglomus occultum TaxID=144539 RepID=A0A9N9AJB8_9GLOM|nr:9694_t:CDS:2 [Paraglomus occultum]
MGLETLTDSSARIRANELITQKDSIENEIREQEQILKGQGVGMSEPLVDRSGFPRDDVDLVVVRTARARIIALHRAIAFALVNAVAPDSPASEAGLQRNDKIIRFGHLHADNHQALQAVNSLVSGSENESIDVTIERGDEGRLVLKLTPKRGWGGRGLLGCHIIPIKGAK